MPGKPRTGEQRIQAAIAALGAALTESGAPWMVIGGIAVIARGVRRMTTDVDAVVRGDAIGIAPLLRLFARHSIVPRIDAAEAFAKANLVLLLRHRPSDVELDVSFGWTVFEHEALDARSVTRYGKVAVPMASAEDLVIMKAMAARPTDVTDAAELLAIHPSIDLSRVKRTLAQLAEMAGEPALAEGLADILALVPARQRRPSTRARTVSTRKRPRRAPKKR